MFYLILIGLTYAILGRVAWFLNSSRDEDFRKKIDEIKPR